MPPEGSAPAGGAAGWHPRIYYLHPLRIDGAAGLRKLAAHAAGLGFTHLLTAPPFAPGRRGDVFLTADHEVLQPGLGGGDMHQGLAALAESVREEGLELLLDLVLDRVAEDSRLAREHADWFRFSECGGCDPRRPPAEYGAALVRFEDAVVGERIGRIWSDIVAGLCEAGIAGFRVLDPHHVPGQVLKRIIEAARTGGRDVRFLAWTPGLDSEQLARLDGTGFDAACSSTPWWDFAAHWLFDEHARLRRIGSVLGAPEAPFGSRLAATVPDPQVAQRLGRRNVTAAAALFDGLIVPAGFEFGARDPLEPDRGSPADFEWDRERAVYDLSGDVRSANEALAGRRFEAPEMLKPLNGPGARVGAIMADPGSQAEPRLILVNRELREGASIDPAVILAREPGFGELQRIDGGDRAIAAGDKIWLAAGEVQLMRGRRTSPIVLGDLGGATSAEAAAQSPRIAVEAVSPVVDGGRFAVKRTVGETVTVEADIFSDGHDVIAAALMWRPADETGWREVRMQPIGNDRWRAAFPLSRVGPHRFTIQAWRDAYGSFSSDLAKKHEAGKALPVDVEEGRQMIAGAAKRASGDVVGQVSALVERFDAAEDDGERISVLLAPETQEVMSAADAREFSAQHEPAFTVEADRLCARFGSWYELFPRSQTDDPARHGTLRDVIPRLPAVRDMGFDVLYFPPIHPIGRTNRKGRNNALTAQPDDPGSPYAIGSGEGGHDAIHRELGSFEDFAALNEAAHAHGMEIALDFAIQCSPDHPWLKEHPEWFAWRADGSLRYAENPPKKYEDIVNVDFYADGAVPSLWLALRDVVEFWVEHGVRIFRVDNPHTKPLPFWEWLIADIRARHPDVIFLAEAFTRPKMMHRLAKIGFTQSYTYFTWRNHKQELREYLEELTKPPVVDFYRPNFFVNTPDINPYFLQGSGRPGFLIRAALACLLSSVWGMYSGFEICEAAALPGREEYLDAEKYEIRVRDWNAPGNIVSEIARLNRIRRDNPALQDNRHLRFYNAWNDNILYFGKLTPDMDNVVLAAVSLDPHASQEAGFEAPLWEWGLPDSASLLVEDLMSGREFVWNGKLQTMRLDPEVLPFAVWRVRPAGGF